MLPAIRVEAVGPAIAYRRAFEGSRTGDVSIIIAPANRADDLRDTLASLATIHRACAVELVVVDNRSAEATRQVADGAGSWFRFPVRSLFEPEEGKYAALNSGIRATSGAIIAATDD